MPHAAVLCLVLLLLAARGMRLAMLAYTCLTRPCPARAAPGNASSTQPCDALYPDLVFLLHTSLSISQSDFTQMKQFVYSVAQLMTIAPNASRSVRVLLHSSCDHCCCRLHLFACVKYQSFAKLHAHTDRPACRVALVSYSSGSQIVNDFNQGSTLAAVSSNLAKMPFLNRGTATGAALLHTRSALLLSPSSG